jgi:hypothetical protein
MQPEQSAYMRLEQLTKELVSQEQQRLVDLVSQSFYKLTKIMEDVKTADNWHNEPEVIDEGPYCLNCDGSGLIKSSPPTEFIRCPVCQGTGLNTKL